jgi:hypothetical protein
LFAWFSLVLNYYSLYSFFIITINFELPLPFILFKVFVQIYNIISYILILFNNKINHTKIYNILKFF